MNFSINLPLALMTSSIKPGDWVASIRVMAQAMEKAGFSAALMSEHPAPSAEWVRNDPVAHDCFDCLIGLSVIAACTTRLKIFTNVYLLPLRNPFISAKAAATAHILSDNRLIFGVGVGYQKEEVEACGVDFKARGVLTDEALETINLIWGGGEIVKRGTYFDAVGNQPLPVPSPPPPIWIGGGSDAAIKRAARWGDGWTPHFVVPTKNQTVMESSVVSMANYAEKAQRLADLRASFGRTGPFDYAVSPPFRPDRTAFNRSSAQRCLEEVHQLAEHDVNWIWTAIPSHSAQEFLDLIAWYSEEVIAPYKRAADPS